MENNTVIRQDFEPKHLHGFQVSDKTSWGTLDRFGVSANQKDMKAVMDEFPEMGTPASVATPIQFLQWLNPEVITYLTTKRDIDELLGVTMAGSWADKEVIQSAIELLGSARPYGDKADDNLASYNVEYNGRTIVRFGEALEVGKLEAEQSAKARIDTYGTKKLAVSEVLEVSRNLVGYYGYLEGANKTYGFLNDPDLPDYVAVASGAGGSTTWSSKTYLEIVKDLIGMISDLQVKTGNNYNPLTTPAQLDVSLSSYNYLNTQNDLGTKSVLQWLKETYPLIEVKASSFLDGANGGANVAYLWATKLGGKGVIKQFIQDKMRFLGMDKFAKVTRESYSNATAGVMVLQPVGVVRKTGI